MIPDCTSTPAGPPFCALEVQPLDGLQEASESFAAYPYVTLSGCTQDVQAAEAALAPDFSTIASGRGFAVLRGGPQGRRRAAASRSRLDGASLSR